MRAVINRSVFNSACQLARGVVPNKDIMPVLKNLKMVVDGDCTLIATDMECGLRLKVSDVKVEDPGEALIPCVRMIDVLKESQDETMRFETTDSGCVVYGMNSEFEMQNEALTAFPDFQEFSEEKNFEIEAGTLKQMIRRTGFAAASDNARYAMNGVLWEYGDKLVLVATDGRRLAVCEGETVDGGAEPTGSVTHVVPSRSMSILERLLIDPDENVRVCLRPNEAMFRTGRADFYTRLSEGRYPPYREVFPKGSAEKILLTGETFHQAVRQAAIMTDDEVKKILLTFAKGKLTISAKGNGRSKVELPIEYSGKELKISFGAEYLTEMLRVVEQAPLVLEIVNGTVPAVFRCGDDYSYVVMPLTTG